MNDARALRTMKFANLEEIDVQDDWAEILTSRVRIMKNWHYKIAYFIVHLPSN